MELYYKIKEEWVENYTTFFFNDSKGWLFISALIISVFLLRYSLKLGWKWNKNKTDAKSKKNLFNMFFAIINFGFILKCLFIIISLFPLTLLYLFGLMLLATVIVYGPKAIYNFYVTERPQKPWWKQE